MPYDNPPQEQSSVAEQQLRKRLEDAKQNLAVSQTQNLQLSEMIKTVAAENRGDANTEDIYYTENVLAMREFQEREGDKLSGYAKELASSINNINIENRKLAKFEQRNSLKELKRIEQMAETVTSDDERQQLNKFIADTRTAIMNNTGTFETIASRLVGNMDFITAGLTAVVSESPLLAGGIGLISNQIKKAWQSRQEDKYAVQEARERQLSEQLGEQLALENEISKLSDEVENLANVQKPTDNTPQKVEIANGGTIEKDNSESNMWLEGIHDFVDIIAMESMQLNETLGKISIGGGGSNGGVVSKMDTGGIIKAIDDLAYVMIGLESKSEEDRREENRYRERVIDALEKQPVKVNTETGQEESGGLFKGKLGKVFSGLLAPLITMGKSFVNSALSFVVRGIPKLITKVFVPALIVASLFSGVMESLNVYKETGSIGKAITGFFGGVLDFVTFGFFGTEELESLISTVSEFIEPIKGALMKPFAVLSDLTNGWVDSASSFISDNFGEFASIGEKIVSKVKEIKDWIVGGVSNMVDTVKNFSITDFVKESLGFETKKPTIETKVKSGGIHTRIDEMASTKKREKLTDGLIKQNDETKKSIKEREQEYWDRYAARQDRIAANIVNNSNVNNTVIQNTSLSAHDPDMTLRMSQYWPSMP